jgi:hypothetical protein
VEAGDVTAVFHTEAVSTSVPLDQLADQVALRDFAYLVCTGDEGQPRVLALRPAIIPDHQSDHQSDHEPGHEPAQCRLLIDLGTGGTMHAVLARPTVTLVFPPTDADHLSLVIDGRAHTDAATGLATVTATGAVRHRAAPSAPLPR